MACLMKEVSPYDLTKGRIVTRLKNESDLTKLNNNIESLDRFQPDEIKESFWIEVTDVKRI